MSWHASDRGSIRVTCRTKQIRVLPPWGMRAYTGREGGEKTNGPGDRLFSAALNPGVPSFIC